MKIVICGAGEVGSHAAEVLAGANNHITVVDVDAARLRTLEESMDLAIFIGDCADASVLRQAGAATADWLIAATNSDEVNLLSASIAKGVGTRHTIARVHHRSYFENQGLDYQTHMRIDHLICPEYSTALDIARLLRNPAALAIEDFARGQVEMQQFPVNRAAPAVGRALVDVPLPPGARLAAVTRKGGTFIPDGTTVIDADDTVLLVANREAFSEARQLFHSKDFGRRRVVLMGGGSIAAWLCRALRERSFALRLFETDPERAQELAEELDWVTVLRADPTDRAIFDEEKLGQADVFISLLDDDEANIIAGVLAKTRGVAQVITVVQQAKYLDVIYDIGVDHAFSPRKVAAEEIDVALDEGPLRLVASLATGVIEVYRVRVGGGSSVLGKPLHEIRLTPDCMITAIQRGDLSFVPHAQESIQPGDVLLAIARHGTQGKLKRLFLA